jgi:hypothetical protein
MIPVYYFEKMPDVLPDDDACYIVSKHIYLKKKTGLIDSMVQVQTIDMGAVLPEYARMNLPKIKAKTFGEVVGFFGMTFKEHRSEAGTILNLKTHPTNPKLKKIDYTVPHQRVSGGACKYDIVIDPSYLNCGTIHSHADFGAFHSGTDVNDEKYFDGLHITVGHVTQLPFCSISASVVVNGKRILVDPCHYIEGIRLSKEKVQQSDMYEIIDKSTIVEIEKYKKMVTPMYTAMWATGYTAPATQKQTRFDWASWNTLGETTAGKKLAPCEECVFKELKTQSLLDDIEFLDDDLDPVNLDKDLPPFENDNFGAPLGGIFEDDEPSLFKPGEMDENGVTRKDRALSFTEFASIKKSALSNSIKCTCGTTFFVDDPEKRNICPSCELDHPAQKFTMEDAMALKG